MIFVMLSVSALVFGLIVGSFLNVVILRYNTGKTIYGRSMCLSCSVSLLWYELVPLVSFVLLTGKCRACKGSISPQYPIVELLTGSVFLLLFLTFFTGVITTVFLLTFFYYAVVSSILIVILVYDFYHKIIPDGLVYFLILLSFVSLFFSTGTFTVPSLLALASGPLLALPLFLLWFFSKGTWMGLGDAKLMLALGWFLGLLQGVFAFMLAFWIGAFISVALLFLRKKQLTMKSEIAFAPFLIVSFFITFFFDLSITNLLL